MLRLEKIKIGKKKAEADYYPENGEKCGHVVVDLKTSEFDSYTTVCGYGMGYLGHARQELERMAGNNDTAEKKLIMWY